jgi:hypothetical protein
MPSHLIHQSAHARDLRDRSSRLLPCPLKEHTQLQQVAACLHVDG